MNKLWSVGILFSGFATIVFMIYFIWLRCFGGLDFLMGQNQALVVTTMASTSFGYLAFTIWLFRAKSGLRASEGLEGPSIEAAPLHLQLKATIVDSIILSPFLLIRNFYFPKSAAIALLLIALRSVIAIYHIVFDSTTGATIGKRLQKLRVVTKENGRLPVIRAIIRVMPIGIMNLVIFTYLLSPEIDLQSIIDGWVDVPGLEYAISQDFPAFEILLNLAILIPAINIIVLALNPQRRSLSDILSGAIVRHVP